MDHELVSHAASFCSPPSSPSFFSTTAAHSSVLEIMSCGIPEQWLVAGDEVDDEKPLHQLQQDDADWALWAGSHSACSQPPSAGKQPPVVSAVTDQRAVARKRGRKPGPRLGPAISHVEAERQRREKLNRRFCDLRAAVPTVSRMDKASLLADAAAYIAELRGRVEQLEAKAKQQAAGAAASKGGGGGSAGLEEKLEVRMAGRDAAALRLTTAAASRHAAARLMCALRALDLPVRHACVSRAGGGGEAAATVQDVVVDVPAALQDEGCLRAALLHMLQQQDE